MSKNSHNISHYSQYERPPPYDYNNFYESNNLHESNNFYSSVSLIPNNVNGRTIPSAPSIYPENSYYSGYQERIEPIQHNNLRVKVDYPKNKVNYPKKKGKKVNYHGPVINSVSSGEKYIHVTKKYQGKEISSTYLPYPQNLCVPVFTGVDSRVAIPGASMLPFINTNSNQMGQYFREQERLLKNRHQDEILRLEAQKVYTNIIRHF